MIPGQPGNTPIAVADVHAMTVRRQIVQQCMMGNSDAMRESGGTA